MAESANGTPAYKAPTVSEGDTIKISDLSNVTNQLEKITEVLSSYSPMSEIYIKSDFHDSSIAPSFGNVGANELLADGNITRRVTNITKGDSSSPVVWPRIGFSDKNNQVYAFLEGGYKNAFYQAQITARNKNYYYTNLGVSVPETQTANYNVVAPNQSGTIALQGTVPPGTYDLGWRRLTGVMQRKDKNSIMEFDVPLPTKGRKVTSVSVKATDVIYFCDYEEQILPQTKNYMEGDNYQTYHVKTKHVDSNNNLLGKQWTAGNKNSGPTLTYADFSPTGFRMRVTVDSGDGVQNKKNSNDKCSSRGIVAVRSHFYVTVV